MILGAILWALGKRRADVIDAAATVLWALMGAGLIGVLWKVVTGQD